MTNPNKTHISIVVDRSGSMGSVRKEAENAINHFLTEQKNQPGECDLLLVDFDAQDPHRVVFDGSLAKAPEYLLDPRGMTPLLDAVGYTIKLTGDRLGSMAEDDRPGKIIFVIQTDGMENASREYNWERVAAMVKEQTDTYAWQFIFLGMGLDTFKQGSALGIQNVISTDANNAVTHDHTHSVMSAYTSQYRGGQTKDMSAMRGMHVNSAGTVTNQAGEEVDPTTGEPIKIKS